MIISCMLPITELSIDGSVSPDFKKVVDRSRTVADGMSKGIEFLFKKNKIEVIHGTGKLKSPGVVDSEC
jgi:dihydrolipoamide dehydrogenase